MVQTRGELGDIKVKATASAKWPTVDEASAALKEAQEDLARAQAVEPVRKMNDAELQDALRVHNNAIAYAQKQIAAIQDELARRSAK